MGGYAARQVRAGSRGPRSNSCCWYLLSMKLVSRMSRTQQRYSPSVLKDMYGSRSRVLGTHANDQQRGRGRHVSPLFSFSFTLGTQNQRQTSTLPGARAQTASLVKTRTPQFSLHTSCSSKSLGQQKLTKLPLLSWPTANECNERVMSGEPMECFLCAARCGTENSWEPFPTSICSSGTGLPLSFVAGSPRPSLSFCRSFSGRTVELRRVEHVCRPSYARYFGCERSAKRKNVMS